MPTDTQYRLIVSWPTDSTRFHDTHPTTLGHFMSHHKLYRGSPTFGTHDRDESTRPRFWDGADDEGIHHWAVSFPHVCRCPIADTPEEALTLAREFFPHATAAELVELAWWHSHHSTP
jgi:hypothetical protein